ncbi:MAG: serine hydrolase [Deltaproteobacteria bacterium]
MKKFFLGLLLVVLVGGGIFAFIYQRQINRLAFATSLFSGAEQYENFGRIEEIFPTSKMTAAATPFRFAAGKSIDLPATFPWQGGDLATGAFLEATDTAALLVIENGRIRFEEYWLTGGPYVTWLSMSVAKSFISALVGIAIEEGKIRSIEDPITTYLPELKESAYEGVRIKDILQMSSGAGWDETYGDPDSDINRFGRILALGGSLNEFATSLKREREPGTYNHYNSTDTQVLGWLLTEVTGGSVAAYTEEKLWHPLGMEADGFWMVDSQGMEMTFGGLNASARDYAKLGELYRGQGRWQDRELVPSAWVQASVTPDAPHLLPGDHALSDFPLGYGYQWWVPEGDEGEYSAIGVYNQFIYVNPARALVIVKLSANSDYATAEDGSADMEFETIELFRAIGRKLAASPAESQ